MFDSTCKFIATHFSRDLATWLLGKPSQGGKANREAVLGDVASRIEGLSERRVQSNLAASTAILAGLILDKELIQPILREEIMRESVIYQEIKAEGREEGRQEGRAEGLEQGRLEEGVALILRLLNRRFGQVALSLEVQVRQLPIEQ